MRAKDFKERCIKRKLTKCEDTVRTYDQLQTVYADMLQNDNEIVSFKCKANESSSISILEIITTSKNNGRDVVQDLICNGINVLEVSV